MLKKGGEDLAKLSHRILRQKMLECGLKQETFAEMLGISVRHIRNLCYRDIDVSVSLCYRMSQILHTPMENLLVVSDGDSDMQEDMMDEYASYRRPMAITQLLVTPACTKGGYFLCPRCKITLDREFVSYCDRCGQRLDWRNYKKAETLEYSKSKL